MNEFGENVEPGKRCVKGGAWDVGFLMRLPAGSGDPYKLHEGKQMSKFQERPLFLF
jgi:hypothetical protein